MHKNAHIQPLDGIRGLAVLLVVFSHGSYQGLEAIPGWNFDGLGKVGVFIFFVLSAFLLTYGLLTRTARPADLAPQMGTYLLRRFLRIYPLFFVALVANYLVTLVVGPFYIESVGSILRHLLLLEGRGTLWTIPVEFGYYLILPIVTAGLLTLRANPILATVATTIVILAWDHYFPPEYKAHVIPFVPVFVMGSLAAFWHHRLSLKQPKVLKSVANGRILNSAAIIMLLVLALLTPALFGAITGFDTARDHFHYNFLLLGTVATTLLLTTIWSSGIVRKLFESNTLAFFGKISFSLYIWHIFFANAFGMFGADTPMLSFYLYLLLSTLVSWLSYKLIEAPFLRISSMQELHALLRSLPRRTTSTLLSAKNQLTSTLAPMADWVHTLGYGITACLIMLLVTHSSHQAGRNVAIEVCSNAVTSSPSRTSTL